MAAIPYMPLYVADYLADAAHLSTVEHGAYLLLIMTYWQRGKALPNSNERLANVARMSNEEWMKVRDTLSEFFTDDGENWVHERIERELAKFREKSDKARAAGQASAERRSNKRSTSVQRTSNHTDTDTDTYKEKANSAEPPAHAPAVEHIPLNDGSDFPITETHVAEYQRLYPAVVVPQELREMRGWCLANPTKRKTKRGVLKFVNAWLGREQDKPRTGGTNAAHHREDSQARGKRLRAEYERGLGQTEVTPRLGSDAGNVRQHVPDAIRADTVVDVGSGD